MTEQHNTAIATLSFSTGSRFQKIDGLNLCEEKHIHENATKNFVCADMVSRKGDHLINEDPKVSQAGDLKELKKENIEEDDVPHCVLEMIPYCILEKKDPILVMVKVLEGTAMIGTPLCLPCRDSHYIGRIVLILKCKRVVNRARKGQVVVIKVVWESGEQPRLRCRNAMARELLVSCKSRE